MAEDDVSGLEGCDSTLMITLEIENAGDGDDKVSARRDIQISMNDLVHATIVDSLEVDLDEWMLPIVIIGKTEEAGSSVSIGKTWHQAAISCSAVVKVMLRPKVLRGHRGCVTAVAVDHHPEGNNLIVTGAEDKIACVWSAKGAQWVSLEGHSEVINGVAMHPNGSILTCSNDKTIRMWNSTGDVCTVLEGHLGCVTAVTTHPDGRILSCSYGAMV